MHSYPRVFKLRNHPYRPIAQYSKKQNKNWSKEGKEKGIRRWRKRKWWWCFGVSYTHSQRNLITIHPLQLDFVGEPYLPVDSLKISFTYPAWIAIGSDWFWNSNLDGSATASPPRSYPSSNYSKFTHQLPNLENIPSFQFPSPREHIIQWFIWEVTLVVGLTLTKWEFDTRHRCQICWTI